MTRTPPLSVAVLISGRGSNLQALIDAAASDPEFPARIAVVLSNVADAYGLVRAQAAGIDTLAVNHCDYTGRAAFENAMTAALAPYKPDIIALAGFMRILSPVFINAFPPGRIVNIHPSLLPDYKGLDTHARVLADNRTETGCTVHAVTPDLDSGPILVQEKVPVLPGDTPDALAARVLEAEHRAYPAAIKRLALGLRGGQNGC